MLGVSDMLRRKQQAGEIASITGGRAGREIGLPMQQGAAQGIRGLETMGLGRLRNAAEMENIRRQQQQAEMVNKLGYARIASEERMAREKLKALMEIAKTKGAEGQSKLTDTQGQAAMLLEQAANNFGQAKEMGPDIMPSTGWRGAKEGGAWKAREFGFPQFSSDKELARQSILWSIAIL